MENKDMIVRKLAPQEKYRASMVMAVAFEGSFDLAKEKEKAENPPALEEAQGRVEDTWAALSPDEKTIYSTYIMNHYTVNFDGHKVKMGGVGGVATLPAYRRKGGVRACITAGLKDLYENGFLLSALYPFSDSYYRQYGYECGGAVHVWTVPLDSLRLPEQGGTIEQLFPGDDTAPLLEVYDEFYKDYNLAADRAVYDKSLEKDNLLDQQRYIFVWRDEAGKPGGFFISHKDKDRVLDLCTSFPMRNGLFAVNARALAAMLRFIKTSYSAYCKSVRFHLPADIAPESLFAEQNPVECKRVFNAMFRIVNAEKAFALCRCRGKGALTVRVEDNLLAENNGTFLLTFAPGTENRVEKTDANPDITLNISDLTVLLCGSRSADELIWMPGAVIHNPQASFDMVFYHKKCHMLELF